MGYPMTKYFDSIFEFGRSLDIPGISQKGKKSQIDENYPGLMRVILH